MAETNPNGANQFKPDPRQSLFLAYYLDPQSETFSNGYQSALKAGYEEVYAKDLVSKMPDWLARSSDVTKYDRMLKKAEARLEFLAESEDEKVSADVSKFISSRIGKKTWSERVEHTGEDGKPISIAISKEISDKNEINSITSSDS